jgi:hypothetical protein
MADNKYIGLNSLSIFLDNIKDTFATKTEVDTKSDKTHIHKISDISSLQSTLDDSKNEIDIIESLALINKASIEANASALKTMQTDIEALAVRIKANEESLANFVAVSSQEINTLF